MNPISFQEDPGKRRTSTILSLVISLVVAAIGLVVVLNLRYMGYIEAALGGCMLGAGAVIFVTSLVNATRLGKPPITLIAADDQGVTLSTGLETSRRISWNDIQAVRPAKKGVQSGVSLVLSDPEGYFNSLDNKEKKAAKQNKSFFGSPASVSVKHCATPRDAIAAEIERVRQTVQVSQ